VISVKKMRPSERREKILEMLCIRRQDTVENLATEFQVSERTIKYDIEELTLTYPIETIRGRYGGGVKVKDGYYVGRNYLKPPQKNLLMKLLSGLSGKEAEIMNSIIKDFSI
jgi:predicted DNA-binding transcriptional regulator YafY